MISHERIARIGVSDSVDYPRSFLSWLAKRTPTVRQRLLRLNPPPLYEGKRLRGYHPHRRTSEPWGNLVGKRQFIVRYGRHAWAALPRFTVLHNGHRKAVSRETVLDNLWMLPHDHPLRHAFKGKNGEWIIPDATLTESGDPN